MPRVQIITRKGYGGAFVVMNSKSIGADLAFAWPSAEIAVMDAERRGQHHLPAGDRVGRRPGGAAGRARRGVHASGSRTRTTRPSAATSTTSSTPRDTRKVLVRVARDAAHEEGEAAAAQARERAALVAAPAPFELRSISPDATPEEVAAITAAIAASIADRAAGAARGRRGGAERVARGSQARACRGPARRLLAGRVAALGPPRPAQPRVTVTRGAVRDAEVMTVGPDEVVVTFVTDPGDEVTTPGRRPRRSRRSGRTTSPASTGSSRRPSTRSRSTARRADEFLPGRGAHARGPAGAAARDARDRERRALRRDRVRAARRRDGGGARPGAAVAAGRAAVPRDDEPRRDRRDRRRSTRTRCS